MGFESYDAYLSANSLVSASPVQYFKSHLQAVADSVFEISSNFYRIKHRKKLSNEWLAMNPEWVEVGVRLVTPFEVKQTSLVKDDFFNVIFKDFDYDVSLGDMFEFNNYMWMVINTSNINSLTNSALVQRCNVKLRFTEREPLNSNIVEIYAVANKFILRSLKEEQFIMLPDNKLHVMIPNDFLGRKVKWTDKGGTRFLIGNPYQNWRTTSYDNISLSRKTNDGLNEIGILKLQIELSEINTGMDDLVNGVAWQDYF